MVLTPDFPTLLLSIHYLETTGAKTLAYLRGRIAKKSNSAKAGIKVQVFHVRAEVTAQFRGTARII